MFCFNSEFKAIDEAYRSIYESKLTIFDAPFIERPRIFNAIVDYGFDVEKAIDYFKKHMDEHPESERHDAACLEWLENNIGNIDLDSFRRKNDELQKAEREEDERVAKEKSLEDKTSAKYSNPIDKAYFSALAAGDRDRAFGLVRKYAVDSGYTSFEFHGTSEGPFNSFNTEWICTTNNRDIAYGYTKGGSKPHILTLALKGVDGGEIVIDCDEEVASHMKIETISAGHEKEFRGFRKFLKDHPMTGFSSMHADSVDTNKVVEFLSSKYGDRLKRIVFSNICDPVEQFGYHHGEGIDIGRVTFTRNSVVPVKLLDIETNDDDGNVIPLSKRFDDSVDDIRY